MDFQMEHDQHLGSLGGGEGVNHNYIYMHNSFGYKAGE
jgi:hypothetical protein